MNAKTVLAIQEAAQAMELARSALFQLHQKANKEDSNEGRLLTLLVVPWLERAHEMDRQLSRIALDVYPENQE